MHKMSEANIKRGEKWSIQRKKAEFEKRDTDVKWMDSQKAIVDDIKEYEDYEKLKEESKKAGFDSVKEYQADLEKKRLVAEAKAKKEAEAKAKKEAKAKEGN